MRAYLSIMTASATLALASPALGDSGISGTVTGAGAGPLSGMCVQAFATNDPNNPYAYNDATTDANGNYTITPLPADTYRVEFSSCGAGNWLIQYYNGVTDPANYTPVSVGFNQTVTGIDATLQQGGRITGTVTSAADHTPASGVCVDAYDDNGQSVGSSAITASDGTYTIQRLPSGYYRIDFHTCSPTAWQEQWYAGKGSLATADRVPVNAGNVTPNIDVQMSTGGTPPGNPAPTETTPATTTPATTTTTTTTPASTPPPAPTAQQQANAQSQTFQDSLGGSAPTTTEGARACTDASHCAPFSAISAGACLKAIGGNVSVQIVALGGCMTLVSDDKDGSGNRVWMLSSSVPLTADGILFSPPRTGGVGSTARAATGSAPLTVTMYADSNGDQHFEIKGSATVTFEGITLSQGIFDWAIDPVISNSHKVWAVRWKSGGSFSQANLPIPAGQTFQVAKLLTASPPTFDGGTATTDVTVQAPAVAGGATSDPVPINTGYQSLPALPWFDDANDPLKAALGCNDALSAPEPVSNLDEFSFPSISIGGFGFSGNVLMGELPRSAGAVNTVNGGGSVMTYIGRGWAPSYLTGDHAMRMIFQLGTANAQEAFPYPTFACATLGSVVPIGPAEITDLHFGIVTIPALKIEGGGTINIGDQIPYGSHAYPLTASGDFTLGLPEYGGDGPWTIHNENHISLLGNANLDGSLDFSSVGYVSGQISEQGLHFLGFDIGAASVNATFDDKTWQIEGNVSVAYNPLSLTLAGSDLVISNLGIGACATLANWQTSVSETWSGKFDYDLNDCSGSTQVRSAPRPTCGSLRKTVAPGSGASPLDVGLAEAWLNASPPHCVETGGARRRAAASPADASSGQGFVFAFASGHSAATLVLHGAGDAPIAAVDGPGGVTCSAYGGTGVSAQPQCAVLRDAATQTTKITFKHPGAGPWFVHPADLSPMITSYGVQYGLPAPRIRASAKAVAGGRMRLTWSGVPTDGRSVTFREQGSGVGQSIGAAKAARGKRTFTPAAGPAGTRSIVALVTVGGVVRQRIVVAHERVRPRILAAPRLRVSGHGRSATVTFAKVPGAGSYRATVTGSDHRHFVTTLTTRRLPLRASAPGRSTVRVVVQALDPSGTAGRAGSARVVLSLPAPKTKSPRFRKKGKKHR
ncbi:MAG: domain containing protein [Solirubrobacteraceae bacterium]|nr:domain containing protein [Solirubrobacteraceae bacterium]